MTAPRITADPVTMNPPADTQRPSAPDTMGHPQPERAAVAAPLRLNCAGYCNFCAEQGCHKPTCITSYRNSWWTICDRCAGLGSDGHGTPCTCLNGVMQVGALTTGAVQPPKARRWPV